jgi:hypothetical protein
MSHRPTPPNTGRLCGVLPAGFGLVGFFAALATTLLKVYIGCIDCAESFDLVTRRIMAWLHNDSYKWNNNLYMVNH